MREPYDNYYKNFAAVQTDYFVKEQIYGNDEGLKKFKNKIFKSHIDYGKNCFQGTLKGVSNTEWNREYEEFKLLKSMNVDLSVENKRKIRMFLQPFMKTIDELYQEKQKTAADVHLAKSALNGSYRVTKYQ